LQISSLSGLVSLTSLNLSNCENLVDISPLAGLVSLINLDLSLCENLHNISLSGLGSLTSLDLRRCKNLYNISLSGLGSLTSLNLNECKNLHNISLSGLSSLTSLDLYSYENLHGVSLAGLSSLNTLDLGGYTNLHNVSISGLVSLTSLDLRGCKKLAGISPLSRLVSLTSLNLSFTENLTFIKPISKLPKLQDLDLSDAPHIRDMEALTSLPELRTLRWIDPMVCSGILIQSACTRGDSDYIKENLANWISDIAKSKSPGTYLKGLIDAVALLDEAERRGYLASMSVAMRQRGLQNSEVGNEIDSWVWEKWCQEVAQLPLTEGLDLLSSAVQDLSAEMETQAILSPVIQTMGDLADAHPAEQADFRKWVQLRLDPLQVYPEAQRQIAPSAAYFHAVLDEQVEVERWLRIATTPESPRWRDQVLRALVGFYARRGDIDRARSAVDEINIQAEKEAAIGEMVTILAPRDPLLSATLLDRIENTARATQTAWTLLEQPSMHTEPQAIYRLVIHLQDSPEELAECLTTLIEKDPSGQVAAAFHSLIMPAPVASAAVLLEWCGHPAVAEYTRPIALKKYTEELQANIQMEKTAALSPFLDALKNKGLIEEAEMEALRQKILG